MKKLLLIFLLIAWNVKASGLNSSYELVYIYGTFIAIVLIIVGIDFIVKLIYKKLKERKELFNNSSIELNHTEE